MFHGQHVLSPDQAERLGSSAPNPSEISHWTGNWHTKPEDEDTLCIYVPSTLENHLSWLHPGQQDVVTAAISARGGDSVRLSYKILRYWWWLMAKKHHHVTSHQQRNEAVLCLLLDSWDRKPWQVGSCCVQSHTSHWGCWRGGRVRPICRGERHPTSPGECWRRRVTWPVSLHQLLDGGQGPLGRLQQLATQGKRCTRVGHGCMGRKQHSEGVSCTIHINTKTLICPRQCAYCTRYLGTTAECQSHQQHIGIHQPQGTKARLGHQVIPTE